MNNTKTHKPEDLLKLFDKIISENPYHRRVSVKPICDYYKGLLLIIGTKFFESDKKLLMKYGMKTRWDFIKIRLKPIVSCKEWDHIIYTLDDIRNKVEHNDDFSPNINDLQNFRAEISKFQKWIVDSGKDFFKKSKNLTFKDRFHSEFEWVIREAEALLHEFGDEPYISFKLDTRWSNISILKDTMKERLMQVDKIKEIEYDDLSNLLQLKELISLFRGREDMVLHLNRCPKCGGNIINTTQHFGGTRDDPEPDGFYYRVGCEKCDYYLDDGTEYL